ncbi:TetR/AcrR family transcriptional regulator [Actinomadura rugatobispora]|uniref:TetR/AcrR family transcriptional regulator n=1 Tax=Actinomadura rugatobispora TaxID=1994 RepID=A0ABW1A9I4_9ACTN|nr:TetR/AcrR family transcriptional regulator [Actinomadura rugatobispora]
MGAVNSDPKDAMGEDNGAGLPEGIELAWGLRERPGKGPKRALTLKGIIDAAVRIGSAEGLEAVSMSRVAAEVGVSTMALYRYVPSKNDLLALMTDEVLGAPPPLPDPEAGWREALSAWVRALREALGRYPWLLRAPITGPPIMPNNVRWMEAGLGAMRGMGLPPGPRISLLILLSNFVRSEVSLFHDLQSSFQAASTTEAEVIGDYGAMLTRLADPGHFPELRAIVAEGVFFEGVGGPDEDFVFGLEILMDGLEALVRRCGGGG